LGSDCLYASSFRNYFTPLVGVLFTFPSRYLFTIGRMRVLRLGEWSPHVQTEFHVFRLTRGPRCFLPVRGYHPLWLRFPAKFPFLHPGHWPGPRSLATTNGVSVDVLSSGYLDVSVPQVSSLSGDLNGRVSPFGNPRIKAYSQLPEAYRSVLRPSSPACAKASTRCS
jgi:hypothetical protein